MEPPDYDTWVLPGAPEQVARARRLVTSALGREHPLLEESILLTSELVTNAVVHSRSGGAGGCFTLSVRCSDSRVRVCVKDGGSDAPPRACRSSTQAAGGRGLPIVEALSQRWGFSRECGLNTVWFELMMATVPAGWPEGEPVGEKV